MTQRKKPTILILGSSGFIGSRLVESLHDSTVSQVRVSLHNTDKKTIQCDITNLNKIQAIFHEYKPTLVYHLAGISTVEAGLTNPRDTLRINVKIMKNVLYCIRKYMVNRAVIASTVQVYARSDHPHIETDSYISESPYETSKAIADRQALLYGKKYNLPIVLLRFTNIYGPGDHHISRLIPKITSEGIHKGKISIWGDGSIKRDFIYIDDVVKILLYLGKKRSKNPYKMQTINIGSGTTHSVEEICRIVAEYLQVPLTKVPNIMRANEDPYLVANVDRMRKEIPKYTMTTILDGLRSTIDEYKKTIITI